MSLTARFNVALWAGLVWACSAGLSPASADVGAGDAAASTLQSRPDFSGRWLLDPKASDDPRDRIRQAMTQAMGDGPGMRGGMGRGGGMGGGRQGGKPPGGMAGRGEGPASGEIAELAAVAKTLDITHEDPLLVLADEHGRQQRLFTDFRGASVSISGAPQRVAVAGWEGPVLVVESRLNEGSKCVRQYRIDTETGRLMVSTAAGLRGAQVVFISVYERSGPAAAGARPAAAIGDQRTAAEAAAQDGVAPGRISDPY